MKSHVLFVRPEVATAAVLLVWSVSGCGSDGPTNGPGPADAGFEELAAEAGATGKLPCEVDTVLASQCRECHNAPPRNGAPFPLMTYADTQADYFGKPVWVRMRDAVSSGFMPLAPKPPLDAEQKAILLDWLDQGAPPAASTSTCP